MDKSQVRKLIQQVKKNKAEAMETSESLLTEDMRESLGELSVADNHPADIGTEVYERSRDVALHDRLKHEIDAMDSALQRYQEGKYGVCEHCGKDIPLERLEAIPHTTVCVECSREEEKEEHHSFDRRPVEEDLIGTPFARTFNDGKDQVGFDGEDSWQEVARYGTSDTPQDLGTNRDLRDPNEFYEDGDEVIGGTQLVETIETELDPEFENNIYYSKEHGET